MPRSEKSIGAALTRAARAHRTRLGVLLADLGLFPGQEQILQRLSESEATIGALADDLGVRPPTASKAIARLEAQGLVVRKAAESDGRVVQVALTERGMTRATALADVWDILEAQLTEGLDGKDRKRFRKLLRKAARNLDPSDQQQTFADDEDDTES